MFLFLLRQENVETNNKKKASLIVPLLWENTCDTWEEAVFQGLGRQVLRPLQVQSAFCVAVYGRAPTRRVNLLGYIS